MSPHELHVRHVDPSAAPVESISFPLDCAADNSKAVTSSPSIIGRIPGDDEQWQCYTGGNSVVYAEQMDTAVDTVNAENYYRLGWIYLYKLRVSYLPGPMD